MKKRHLIKIVFVFTLAFATLSCEDGNLTFEKQSLSKEQLRDMLQNDKDFNQFLQLEKERLEELQNNLNQLTLTQSKEISLIIDHYQSYENFTANSSKHDLFIISKLFTRSKKYSSAQYLRLVLTRISNYNYNIDDLKAISVDKFHVKQNLSARTSGACDNFCSDYKVGIYVQQLNHHYFAEQMEIESADAYATIAADWAYVGCMFSCVNKKN
jgi:hypothetical protein